MIHPNDIGPIAKLAYQRFVKTATPAVTWENLPAHTVSAWRDRVIGADRMRKRDSLPIWEEDCALAAIRKFEEDKAGKPAKMKEAVPEMPASEKPTKAKKEK